MKISDIATGSAKDTLKITDLENIFNIYEDDGNYYYNLNETLVIDFNKDQLSRYVVTHDMHWPTISYQLYETTRLAWLLMKANKVDKRAAFDVIPAGTVVYFPSVEVVQSIVTSLNKEW